MIRFGFPDQMLSFGRTKPLPFSLLLHHPLLFPTPAPPYKKSGVPPPFFISLASLKCFLPTLFSPTLDPYDWMVAYAALTLPDFCVEHLPVLQTPPVLSTFDEKIRQPLLSGQFDTVAAYLLALLPPPPSITSEQPWILNSKTRKASPFTRPPTNEHIVQTSLSKIAKSPFHLDNYTRGSGQSGLPPCHSWWPTQIPKRMD